MLISLFLFASRDDSSNETWKTLAPSSLKLMLIDDDRLDSFSIVRQGPACIPRLLNRVKRVLRTTKKLFDLKNQFILGSVGHEDRDRKNDFDDCRCL